MNVHAVRAFALVLLVVLAGCGQDVGHDSPTATSPADGTRSPAPTEVPVRADGTDRSADGELVTSGANGTVTVHFVNVGQSTSTLVVGPTGETMLVDTGDYKDDGQYVLQYLRERGVERIDYLVTTHNDADHIGGNAAVIEYYETQAEGVGAVYDPGIAAATRTYEEYLDAVEAHDVPLYELREGDRIPFEGVRVHVFGPPEPYIAGEERNENSVVLRLAYRETSVLLPGDAGGAQESYLVERYGQELNSTALLAGHHGSRTSTGEPFLDVVSPRLVVISSAYDSQYGHPDEEVLERLADPSVHTYWTGTHGNVLLRTNGEALSVSTQFAAPVTADRLREGSPADPESAKSVTLRRFYGTAGPGEDGVVATPAPATDGGVDERIAGDRDGRNAAAALVVSEVHADAAGDDRENLEDEYVVLANRGDEPVDLSGLRVSDAAGAAYVFPEGVTLAPGETLTLRTGSGEDTASNRYWGRSAAVWNNDGDTVIVTAPDGTVVAKETYG